MKKKLLNFVFFCSLFVTGVFFLKIFFVSSFKIPTDSMSPEIIPGDYIFVNKLAYGARLFDVFAALSGEKVTIYRVPGYTGINRNDVIVFHFPHPKIWGKIEMNMMKYYVKRCIGIPGDTVSIVNGMYQVNDTIKNLGDVLNQRYLKIEDVQGLKEKKLFYSYPEKTFLNWTIKNFGPLYIPKKGDIIKLDKRNILLYKKNIEWEMQQNLVLQNDTLWHKQTPLIQYTFKHNYYFMAGDKVLNSQDSRYWGILPEDFIVGKAWFIWKSKNIATNEWRWKRFFKRIE